jgi:hypothetical protein
LLGERQTFTKKKELLSQQNQFLSTDNDQKEKQLQESQLHSQLEVLEKSLRHWEQNNFSVKECILRLLGLKLLNSP